MKIHATSHFKNPELASASLTSWLKKLEAANNRTYDSIRIKTSLGETQIWGVNTDSKHLETLIIFPGARTTSLIWDFDRGLDNLNHPFRIFLVETNGLPNLSNGATPDIKSLDYGHWASEVMSLLQVDRAFIAGASFGGLICMKLAITNPEKINAAFLLNPGCLQPFSLTFKNLYYNILPLIRPTTKNIQLFLDKAVFSKPNHQLSDEAEKLLLDYQQLAISEYKDNTQKPYFMRDQLRLAKADTYLVVGENDLLFPYNRSITNATNFLPSLKEVKVFQNVGHGIETYQKAIEYVGNQIHKLSKKRLAV